MVYQIFLPMVLRKRALRARESSAINPTNSTAEKYKDDISFKLKLEESFYERKFRKVGAGPGS